LAIQDGSLFTAITSSQQQQREIRLELQGIQGQINSLSEQLDLTPDQAYTSSALSADPIIASIRAQILDTEAQLEGLQKDLRPEHPTVVKLRKQQQVNESLLQKRAAEVIGKDGVLTALPSSRIRQQSNLDATRQQLAAQLVTLQTQREGLMKQLESRLTQAVAFQRGIYENILNALVDAQAAEAETVGSLTVAQPPVAQPIEQVFNRKNRTLILLVGAGLGTLAGLGIRNLEGEEIEPILADANANYLPYYERLRSTLRLVGGGETVKVVVVTSITGGEGKTATAYNLAIAAALAGRRTLLVEGDLRSPSKAEEIGVTPDPNSFREPLLYYGAKSKSIRLAPNIENLSILPSPGPQKQAAAIIESSELQLILKDSRGRFDLVIVDTPSLSSCNDALLLEELADGIILVTRQGITRSNLLSEATDQLTEAEVKILGAVINYVDITPTLNTAEPELPPLIVPPTQEKTETEEVKVEV